MRLNVGPARTGLRCAAAAVAMLGGLAAVVPGRSVAVAATAADVPAPQAGASTVAPRLDWTESLAYSSWLRQANDVTCPTATTCLVAADELRRSTDGGVTWSALFTTGGGYVTDVDCPTAERCYALVNGGQLVLSDDAGATWSKTASNVSGFAALSCPSRSTCYGVTHGYLNAPLSVHVTRDSGTTWTALAPTPAITTDLSDFTCPSETACRGIAQDMVLRTDDGGASWLTSDLPVIVRRFGFACPTTNDCIAVSQSSVFVQRSIDGGATWHTGLIFGGGGLDRLSGVDCASGTHCVIVGSVPSLAGSVGAAATIEFANNTAAFATVAPGVTNLDLVRCRAGHCLALGADSVGLLSQYLRPMVSDDGGATFSAAAVPASASVNAIACPTASHCVAVGESGDVGTSGLHRGGAVRTDDAGATWTPTVLPDAMGSLDRITCATSLRCVAVGASANLVNPALAGTSDGGATWAVPPLSIQPWRLTDVACPSEQVCIVGAEVRLFPFDKPEGRLLRSTDAGRTWSVSSSWAPASPLQIGSIGCISARCVLVAGSATGNVVATSLWLSIDAGVTWTPSPSPATDLQLRGVHCEASECILTTERADHRSELYRSTDLDGAWALSRYGEVTAPRWCTSTGLCAAFGDGGIGIAATSGNGGGTWTTQPAPAIVRSATSVQCPGDRSRCLVVVRGGSRLGTAIYRVDVAPREISSMVPERVLDTRVGADFTTVDHIGGGGGLRAAGAVTVVPVAGRAGLPSDASSVALTVTVTEPTGAGFVTVWPCGADRPTASNLNFTAGATVANTVVSKVGGDGSVCIYNQTPVQLVVDVDAFMSGGSSVNAIVPGRLLDTRAGASFATIDHLGEGAGAPAAGSVTVVAVAGRAGVPADAAGAVLTVTVTDPRASGFVTVWPCGTDRPTASNLNHSAGATVANTVVSKIGSGGAVCIFNQVSTHIVVDVDGFLAAGSHVSSIVPGRLFDSRSGPDFVTVDHQEEGVGKLGADGFAAVYFGSRAGVGFPVTTVVLTVTVTEPTADGFITIWPCEGERPTASNLNYAAGQTVANTVITKASAGAQVCVYTKSPTHLVVDVNGYE